MPTICPICSKELNINLKPGQCVALMGPSGSGKSTLAKLLQGFYQPANGQIKLDGQDIRHLSANELRRTSAWCRRRRCCSPARSTTTWFSPIRTRPSRTSCRRARWPRSTRPSSSCRKGYQTEIGEHGVGLSGGQKQRIAIARALLKRPKILIFDEATSNLDQHTAEQFAKTVNALKGQATMLFIAHQLPERLTSRPVVTLDRAPMRNASGAGQAINDGTNG